MSQGYKFLGLCDILLDGKGGAVEHDGCKAGLNALLCAVVGAVVEVKGYGNRDAEGLVHGLDHGSYGIEAGHILAGALGNTEDDGSLLLLSRQKNGLGPLEIVDVELAYGVVSGLGLVKHFLCINEHCALPPENLVSILM